MNLTHDVIIIAANRPLVQRPRVPEQTRMRHALKIEPIEEGNDEDIGIPLRDFMKRKNSKKPKKK